MCLQSEPGGEGQCVPVEAAVCAGQWSGHSVLCSSTNHDEEGILGRLCREKQRADIRHTCFSSSSFFCSNPDLKPPQCVVVMCMGVWECICLHYVKYFLGMHRLSPVSVTMQIAVFIIGTDNKVEYTTHTLKICVDTATRYQLYYACIWQFCEVILECVMYSYRWVLKCKYLYSTVQYLLFIILCC